MEGRGGGRNKQPGGPGMGKIFLLVVQPIPSLSPLPLSLCVFTLQDNLPPPPPPPPLSSVIRFYTKTVSRQ